MNELSGKRLVFYCPETKRIFKVTYRCEVLFVNFRKRVGPLRLVLYRKLDILCFVTSYFDFF